MFNLRKLPGDGYELSLNGYLIFINPGSACGTDNSRLTIFTHVGAVFSCLGSGAYAGPPACARRLLVEGADAIVVGVGDIIHFGQADIMGVFADYGEETAIGVVITYRKIRIYFTGDTLPHDRLSDVAALDIDILVCGAGMAAGDILALGETLGVRVIIASQLEDADNAKVYMMRENIFESVYSILDR